MSSASPSKRAGHAGVDADGSGGSSSSAARGPAIQRLLVVGPTMGGKRTFVDRLRSSSEAMNGANGQLDGSPPRRLHGRQPREQPQPYKTLHGPYHGCSMHFTSIAYYYSLEAVKRAAQEGGASATNAPSSTAAGSDAPVTALNNTVMEVMVCDTPETILQALPSDPEQLLHSTALVIALSATEVFSVAAEVARWTAAINDAVAAVVAKHNSRVAAAQKQAGGAGHRRGGPAPQQATSATLETAGSTFDIRRLSEARAQEAEVAEAATSGEFRSAFLETARSAKDWIEASADGGQVPQFPESGRCLLPTLILLSKMDVLEEVCKKPQHSSGAGSQLTAFQAAVQHSRWQALQRGAAFAAISNKGYSNAMSAVFDALWRYIAFGLIPQRQTQHHLKLIRRQERKRHKLAAMNGSGGESDEDAHREDDARREIDDAVAAARQRNEDDGTLETVATNTFDDTTIGNSVNMPFAPGATQQLSQDVTYLRSVLSGSTIKRAINATASQAVFVPKGLDDPRWLFKESFASKWLHMYNVFRLIRSTPDEEAAGKDGPPSSAATRHVGKVRLEAFAKAMGEALGSQATTTTTSGTAAATTATSSNVAAAGSGTNNAGGLGGGGAVASPPITSPSREGGGAGDDDDLVWDSI